MKTREKKLSGSGRTGARLAPYQRALERVGAALEANRGGPSDAELIDELRKALFGAEIIDTINKAANAKEEVNP
jgi:hypothetical protein